MSGTAERVAVRLEVEQIQALLDALHARGYRTVGPVVRDGAIVYDALNSAGDLPVGWTDRQSAGQYRLARRTDDALFGYALGPQSWKKFLHPPERQLWRARRDGWQVRFDEPDEEAPKLALIGARACELHAIAIQDRVLAQGAFADPAYAAQRDRLFVVAVNCAQPGGTCFCASMQAGPKVTAGFDLALTEILEAGQHYFVVEVGSESGAEVLGALPHRPAGADETASAARVVERAAGQMGRRLDTADVRDLLYQSAEHPRWDAVAQRCLACANCTSVCPTCFCTRVEDVTDLTGEQAERRRLWDSCFNIDFSYIHGGSVRASIRARYRQWLTHKFAAWSDQFGTPGCVGCGRCITWCPAAIDVTAEIAAFREAAPQEMRDAAT